MADEKEALRCVQKLPVGSKSHGREKFPRYFLIVLSMIDLLKESYFLMSKGFWQKRLPVKIVIFRRRDKTHQHKNFLHVLFVFNSKKVYAW